MRKRNCVCRDCGKQDAYTLAGRALCYECAEKSRLRKKIARKDQKQKEKMLKQHRDMQERRKASGLCPICGRIPTAGHIRCDSCNAKNREYLKAKRHKDNADLRYWEDRASGLRGCFLCGEKCVEGKKLCKRHYAQRLEILRKSNPKSVYMTTEKYLHQAKL